MRMPNKDRVTFSPQVCLIRTELHSIPREKPKKMCLEKVVYLNLYLMVSGWAKCC